MCRTSICHHNPSMCRCFLASKQAFEVHCVIFRVTAVHLLWFHLLILILHHLGIIKSKSCGDWGVATGADLTG